MKTLQYRPHIDGLRAFAVVVVFLFHLNPDLFPGGYLGVDIFFVISGFVISQSLYKNYLKTGSINISKFYLRRFKRLYPALVTMVITTSVFQLFFGFLWDTNLFIKSSITSILAFSNLYFLKHADNYFNQDLINPLLHTWSLGIEEQFYLIYPLILFCLLYVFAKIGVHRIYLALILLSASIALYVTFVLGEGTLLGDFYFPTARFWELIAGCALFFFSLTYKEVRGALFLAVLSLGLLVVLQIFHSSIDNLYFETLLTVMATVGLIFSGLHIGNRITDFFAWSSVVYLGTISYSLYLWHLPVIYFLNLYTPTVLYYVLAPALSLLFAVLSYRYIETPLRHSTALDALLRRGMYLIPIVILVGLYVCMNAGTVITKINSTFNQIDTYITSSEINYIEYRFKLSGRIKPKYLLNGVDVWRSCSEKSEVAAGSVLKKDCLKETGSDSVLYLAGDSHAAHFVPMVDGSDVLGDVYFDQFSRRAIANADGEPLKTQEVLERKILELQALTDRYETVYLMTSLFLSPAQDKVEDLQTNYRKYVETLSPYAQLIFVAPTPVFQAGPESCVAVGVHCTLDVVKDQKRRKVALDILTELAKEYDTVSIYDPYKTICSGEVCSIYDAETNFLRYRDDDHLSVEASKSLTADFDTWFKTTFEN